MSHTEEFQTTYVDTTQSRRRGITLYSGSGMTSFQKELPSKNKSERKKKRVTLWGRNGTNVA